MRKIAFVGQTPPPLGGQAIMIEKILQGNYTSIKLYHIRMAFSKEMDEIGKASISKVFHLFNVIFKIWHCRIFNGAKVLYYPPAGPDKTPVIRDIVILLSTRWMFNRTIFHYHAGGVSEMKIHSLIMRKLFKIAYYNADCAIVLSDLNPADGKNMNAKKQVVIPYGIEDNFNTSFIKPRNSEEVKLLFVAIIKESKGIMILLQACKFLSEKGLNFKLEVMGKFESKEFENKVRAYVLDNKLTERVNFLGVLSGQSKHEAFANSDIFCFPTFFESETFGVVLLEAMQFSLPIVSTFWRGIPSLVKDNQNGFLVETKNAEAVAFKLESLILSPSLRKELGTKGREVYLNNYTLPIFHKNIEQAFSTA